MIRWLQILAFVMAVGGAGFAVRAHRRAPGASFRWDARAGLIVSVGVLAAAAPPVLIPMMPWVEQVGIVIDLIFAITAVMMLRRQRYVAVD